MAKLHKRPAIQNDMLHLCLFTYGNYPWVRMTNYTVSVAGGKDRDHVTRWDMFMCVFKSLSQDHRLNMAATTTVTLRGITT